MAEVSKVNFRSVTETFYFFLNDVSVSVKQKCSQNITDVICVVRFKNSANAAILENESKCLE